MSRAQEAGRGGLGPGWEEGAQGVFLGLREWRALHPTATLSEIEAAVAQRWAVLRGQGRADLALASAASAVSQGGRPAGPDCGGALRDDGPGQRTLRTPGQAALTLTRD